MKHKVYPLVYLLLVFCGIAHAQIRPAPVQTLQNAAAANGNGSLLQNISAYGAANIQITGTFSATVNFEITLNGTNYVAAQATNLSSGAAVTTATAPGIFLVYAPGSLYFRARVSSYVSGAVTVTARATPALARAPATGSGGGAWGDITGTLSDQTDLLAALDLKAPLASPTFTGTLGAAAATFSGAITQTSNSATAFQSGPNGATNPVFRIVNSTASQSDGLSITGLAEGNGVTLAALSSGSNAPVTLTPKGSGNLVLNIASNGQIAVPVNGSASAPAIYFQNSAYGIFQTNGVIQLTAGGENALGVSNTPQVRVKSTAPFGFSSGNVENNSLDTYFERRAAGIFAVTSLFEFTEVADPSVPASNKARLYVRDNGSGKTQLCALFPSGASQCFATEP